MSASVGSHIGALLRADVTVGTAALRSLVDDVAGRATKSVHVDVFRVGDKQVVERLVRLADDGIDLTVLADADATTGKLAKELKKSAAAWSDIGSDPFKQHGKSMSRDGGAEAVVATDIADEDAAKRIELAARFDGDGAKAVDRIHLATSDDEIEDALEHGRALGIVGNDPRAGVHHATEAIHLLVRDGDGPLRVMTKAFDDDDLAERLVAAAKHRDVELLTHDLPRSQQRALEDAGVRVTIVDEKDAEDVGAALHGTLIVSGDRALLGSLYLESRVLHGSNGRVSRELAAVLGGDAATQASRAWDEIVAATRRFTR